MIEQRDVAGAMNSLGTFLMIEMGKFNKLLKKMKSTLVEVQRALKGTVVMSADLDAMCQVCTMNESQQTEIRQNTSDSVQTPP